MTARYAGNAQSSKSELQTKALKIRITYLMRCVSQTGDSRRGAVARAGGLIGVAIHLTATCSLLRRVASRLEHVLAFGVAHVLGHRQVLCLAQLLHVEARGTAQLLKIVQNATHLALLFFSVLISSP